VDVQTPAAFATIELWETHQDCGPLCTTPGRIAQEAVARS